MNGAKGIRDNTSIEMKENFSLEDTLKAYFW